MPRTEEGKQEKHPIGKMDYLTQVVVDLFDAKDLIEEVDDRDE